MLQSPFFLEHHIVLRPDKARSRKAAILGADAGNQQRQVCASPLLVQAFEALPDRRPPFIAAAQVKAASRLCARSRQL